MYLIILYISNNILYNRRIVIFPAIQMLVMVPRNLLKGPHSPFGAVPARTFENNNNCCFPDQTQPFGSIWHISTLTSKDFTRPYFPPKSLPCLGFQAHRPQRLCEVAGY